MIAEDEEDAEDEAEANFPPPAAASAAVAVVFAALPAFLVFAFFAPSALAAADWLSSVHHARSASSASPRMRRCATRKRPSWKMRAYAEGRLSLESQGEVRNDFKPRYLRWW